MHPILGVDIGKLEFHACLLIEDRTWSKKFPNTASGFTQLTNWLSSRKVETVHACLESTGGFEEALAIDLHERGHIASIVNPSRIKAFAKSELLRTKNDAVDAALIARFCRAHRPGPWSPPAPEIRALQALVRRHAGLEQMRQMESNRLGAARSEIATDRSLRDHITYLDREIDAILREIKDLINRHPPLSKQRDLLISIPGIADLTASRILGELPNIAEYHSSKAVAAFAGLSPREHQSGNSRGHTRIAKTGNAQLRAALFYPALAAIRFNPVIAAFYARLLEAGKPKRLAVVAAMRKLLTLAYGVLRSNQPFAPDYTRA